MRRIISLILALLLLPAVPCTGAAQEVPVPPYERALVEALEKQGYDYLAFPAAGNHPFEAENFYPYIGLGIDIPSTMLARMQAGEVFAYGINSKDVRLDFRYVPEPERDRLPHSGHEASIDTAGDFYGWFMRELESLMLVSIFEDKEVENGDLQALTGYPVNEVIARQGDRVLLCSTVPGAALSPQARALLPDLERIKASLVFEAARPADESIYSFFGQPLTAQGDAGRLSTQDLDGQAVTGGIFASKRLTLLNVWATWCGGCIAEMPDLNTLHEEMAGEGVQVVGILFDGVDEGLSPDARTIQEGREAARKLGISYPSIVPDASLMEGMLSNMQIFPTTFIVDAQGRIVGDPIAGSRSLEKWREVIGEYLALLDAQ